MPKGTRENIINAFFSLASKHPSSTHFTLTQIAKEAGISRQSIYQNHFNNYDELIQYIHEMIDADIHSHIEQDLTTKDPITLFGDNIIPLLYSKRTWLRCLLKMDQRKYESNKGRPSNAKTFLTRIISPQYP